MNPMGVEDIKPGKKSRLSDGDVEVQVRGKKTRTTQVLDFDLSFQDDYFEILESLQRCEEERTLRAGNDQNAVCCVDGPEERRVVGNRGNMPVTKPRMRLMPVKEKVHLTGKADDGDNEDDDLGVLFEDFDWERISWEDIDNEEDRLLRRSAAQELRWRLKAEQWMKNLRGLIDG